MKPDVNSATAAGVDRDFIERAVRLADLDAVRVALYQHTLDPEIEALPVVARMDEGQRERLVAKVVAWLQANAGPWTVEEPPEPLLRKLMTLATGAEMGELEFAARRDLPGFKPFPYTARWEGERPPLPEGFLVAIIGSGFAGITMAVQLDLLGIPYVVLERRSEPGGVWSVNRYPDVRVDTSSITYEFSFVKDYAWSEYFGRGREVQAYLKAVSERFGVHDKTRFDHDVTAARFDEGRSTWTLEVDTPGGRTTLDANVVVSAGGLFATPNLPQFEGRDVFGGQVLHPSRWPQDTDLRAKRVAVVGNGSTGVQLLGAIACDAEQVFVFQRTPQWIMPRDKYGKPVEPEIAWLLKNFPGYWNWWRYTATAPLFDTHDFMTPDEEWQAEGGKVSAKSDAMRQFLTDYIHAETGGRQDLINRLTPDYAPFVRRPIVDNGWYRALTRNNVELVTDPIARLTPDGIETAGGEVREVDVIVTATGYEVAKYLWPARYEGVGGVDLHDSWEAADGARAYIGMMVPRFPNLFILYGPNSQPISGGPAQPIWFAVWAAFAAQGIMRLIQARGRRIEVTREAFDRYNAALDSEAAKLTLMSAAAGSASNYYVNEKHGRLQVNAPWYSPDLPPHVQRTPVGRPGHQLRLRPKASRAPRTTRPGNAPVGRPSR